MIIGLGSDLCNIERIQNSLDRFGARFERRWTRSEKCAACRVAPWHMRPCAHCEMANDRAERRFADDAPAERLSDFVFWIDVTHVPPTPPPEDAPPGADEAAELFGGACTLPLVSPDGAVGSGVHVGIEDNALSDDDAALYAAPPLPDSALGPRFSKPRGGYSEDAKQARDAALAWIEKQLQLSLAVQRRSDGAMAVLCQKKTAMVHVTALEAPETTLQLHVYRLFGPLLPFPVSSPVPRRRMDDHCFMDARVELAWRVAGEPRAPESVGHLFPYATLTLSAHCPQGNTYFVRIVEEQVLAMLSVLDWAL